MIIKKYKSLKGKTLLEILFNIGVIKQKKGLRMYYLINRKEMSKLGVCVAKKKIRESVERNVIKRRIINAYKKYNRSIKYLHINVIIFFFWYKKKIPSFRRIKLLMSKILTLI